MEKQSKGGTACVYRGCSNITGQNISMFRFPKDASRSKLWLENCNREDLLLKSSDELYRNYRICEEHFEERYITKHQKKKNLFDNAIPTIFKHSLKQNIIQASAAVMDVAVVSDSISVEDNKFATDDNATIPDSPPADHCSENQLNSTLRRTRRVSTQTESSMTCLSSLRKKLRRKARYVVKLKTKLRMERLMNRSRRKKVTKDEYIKYCDKYLNKELAEIVKCQIRLDRASAKARRYSEEYKQFALTLYFFGPRAYALLSKILILPSKRTLQMMTKNIITSAGFCNTSLFKALENKCKTMLKEDKKCILCMDEMALKANLYYNIGKDEIIGLHDTGNEKLPLTANNAFVIMARGLYTTWKQPLGYCFVNSQLEAENIKKNLEICINNLTDIGLEVEAVISDMGGNFLQLFNILGMVPSKPVFKVGEKKIIYLFDTCHLIKATRNNLLDNIFLYENKRTSWSFIQNFYELDKKNPYRSAPKLTDAHLSPSNFEKMKVKLATQVLSHSVASGMGVYLSLGILPPEAEATRDTIAKLNDAFDILNSSAINRGAPYKNVFEGNNVQIKFLKEMLEYWNSLKILSKDERDVTKKSKFKNCWIVTINGMLLLWDNLQKANFKYLKTRKVNQDCLENFFGSIRQQGGNCVNPTPIQFERAFKKLFTIQYLHTENMNCIDDLGDILVRINSQPIQYVESVRSNKALTLPDYDYQSLEIVTQNAFTYTCGYLLKKCLSRHDCEQCSSMLKDVGNCELDKLLIEFKTFESKKCISGLTTPSSLFIHFIYELEKIFTSSFEEFILGSRISFKFLDLMEFVELDCRCSSFPVEYLRKLFIRMRIFYWLKYFNRELKTDSKNKRRKIKILSHV